MVSMQISLSLVGLISGTNGSSPVDSVVKDLTALRDEGFRRVWMAQMPYDPDLLTILAVAFHEVDTIEVGSGVLPIQVQHPTQLAQRVLTLNAIAGGRFTLGIGMSHRMVTEQMWGISYEKPVRRMREYLDGLLPLLAGQSAEAVGETVTTRGSLQIPGAPTPDVYIAALGPQMQLMYPTPTVFSKHTLVPLNGNGDTVGRLLTTHPELQHLAVIQRQRNHADKQHRAQHDPEDAWSVEHERFYVVEVHGQAGPIAGRHVDSPYPNSTIGIALLEERKPDLLRISYG